MSGFAGGCSLVVARAPVVDEAGGGEESGGGHCDCWGGSCEAEVVVVMWVVGESVVRVEESGLLVRVWKSRLLVSEVVKVVKVVWMSC